MPHEKQTSRPSQAQEDELDEALDETFPASDPTNQSDPTHGLGAGKPKP